MATGTTGASAPPLVEDARMSTSEPVITTHRNLVVCIDGSSNHVGRNNSNVVKLFDTIDLVTTKKKQLAFYSSGIDSPTLHCNGMFHVRSADKNIKEAYGWLAEKYEKGDDIFLFGFSRGAYQVQVLAGMIHEVGLIRERTERNITAAFDYYKEIQPGKPEARQFSRKFKKESCWDDLTVHFIGVWDMVSSVGPSRGDVSLPISSPACYIRHALALDERRVKFMPEYFRETSFTPTEKDLDVQRVDTSGSSQSGAIKEVWFAGSHSDVGGQHMPGKTHHTGNISLLWMYREAVEHGLVLRPTNVTWGPDGIDPGTRNSMSTLWYIPEYIAQKQQVSYRGPDKDAPRVHWSEPRLIMPRQKVHASILYANAYEPLATRGRGFDISMEYGTPEDAELDELFWETDLFGDMEAKELVSSLSRRLAAPECLDVLLFMLFMLRFNKGKQCVSNVPDWQDKFEEIIADNGCEPFVRLVAIVAYYEASCEPGVHSQNPVRPRKVPSTSAFDGAKNCLSSILAQRRHRYNSGMVALLSALTRHEDLRRHILTTDVLETFVTFVDLIITITGKGKVLSSGQRENNFVQVMNGLNSLLQCVTTREFIVQKLREDFPNSNVSRLHQALEVNDPKFLVAALHMMLTLARIQEARPLCSMVKPRIHELTKKRDRIIGPLAVQIWFAVHDPKEQQHPSLRDARVRANIASALVRTNFNVHSFVSEENGDTDLGLAFGLNAERLDEEHKETIRKLTKATQKGSPRVRTTMTMTLLWLCKTPVFRTYLHEINLVGIFVDQLRHKRSALLAAYALATCLKEHPDMKEPIEKNALLPKHIVSMLRLDYFDDAIGQVEGLTIFIHFMQHSVLREGVMKHNLMEVLGRKAGKFQLKNILSGFLYKDKNSTDPSNIDIQALVAKSLEFLRNPDWRVQKTGVTILTALAQMPDAAKIIQPYIKIIFELVLPEKYQPIQLSESSLSSLLLTSASDSRSYPPATTTELTESRLLDALNMLPRPASGMMGPACTLRNLALNRTPLELMGVFAESLQHFIRGTDQYRDLKRIHKHKKLIAERETAPWRIYAPTKSDVTMMLDKMITAVDEELSEEDLMWIGDTLPPGVQHWERAFMFLGYTAAGTALLPVALGASIGFSALTVVALVVSAPIYLSVEVFNVVRRRNARTGRSS